MDEIQHTSYHSSRHPENRLLDPHAERYREYRAGFERAPEYQRSYTIMDLNAYRFYTGRFLYRRPDVQGHISVSGVLALFIIFYFWYMFVIYGVWLVDGWRHVGGWVDGWMMMNACMYVWNDECMDEGMDGWM